MEEWKESDDTYVIYYTWIYTLTQILYLIYGFSPSLQLSDPVLPLQQQGHYPMTLLCMLQLALQDVNHAIQILVPRQLSSLAVSGKWLGCQFIWQKGAAARARARGWDSAKNSRESNRARKRFRAHQEGGKAQLDSDSEGTATDFIQDRYIWERNSVKVT